MGQWEDCYSVFPIPFEKFILVYKAMLAAAPQNTRAHPRQDQQEMVTFLREFLETCEVHHVTSGSFFDLNLDKEKAKSLLAKLEES